MKHLLVKAFCLSAFLCSSLAFSQTENCAKPGAAENLAKAKTFLEENKSKEGVITTDSGLQYKVLKPGNGGDKPRARDTVVTNYELFNLEGKKIESTYDNKAPLQFAIRQVIPGWQEVLVDMTVGEQRTLYIPPHLAYKCKGSAPNIGPNELLIFNMELMVVVK